jgi:hypothetical protein
VLQLWAWIIYQPDGITPLRRGEVTGARSDAQKALSSAMIKLYLDEKGEGKSGD